MARPIPVVPPVMQAVFPAKIRQGGAIVSLCLVRALIGSAAETVQLYSEAGVVVDITFKSRFLTNNEYKLSRVALACNVQNALHVVEKHDTSTRGLLDSRAPRLEDCRV